MDELSGLLRQNRIDKCSVCGGPVKPVRSGEFQCLDCGHMEYDDFGKIRIYLEENGPSSKEQIELATGVSKRTILQYLRESRLQVASTSDTLLQCEICGAYITSGRLCPACSARQSKGQAHLAAGNFGSDAHRMHYLDQGHRNGGGDKK